VYSTCDKPDSQKSSQSNSSQKDKESQSSRQTLSKLPLALKTRTKPQGLSEKDQEGIATLGIQDVLRSDFDSSNTMTESSLSSVEGKRGYDLSWYKQNHVVLYVNIEMDQVDIHASSDDFYFAQDIIEASIQQSFETGMSKNSIFNRCFVNIKATSSRKADRFLSIPLKVVMTVESRGTTRCITLEACPPQSSHTNALTTETMRTELLKLEAKFPVVYKESYKKKDGTPRFWRCSLHQDNPLDDTLCLSVEFQIHFNEEKARKNHLAVWEIIQKWMKTHYNYDMDDAAKYEQRLVAYRQFTAQIAHRVTQPRFYITFNAQSAEELCRICYVLGILHGRTIRLPAKEATSCDNGFDFKFYCTLFDPSIRTPRPISLKATIEKVFQDVTPKTDPESILKSFIFSNTPPQGTLLNLEWLKTHPDLSMLQDVEKAVAGLKDTGVLAVHPAHADHLVITAKFKPWKELRLHLPDQSVSTIQHKDCGIWIDHSLGLPSGNKTMIYKCFSIHTSLAYSSVTRTDVSAWQLEEYMKYRYHQFKSLLHHLQSNSTAMRSIINQHETALQKANGSQIDPDHIANPALWSSLELIQQMASSVGEEAFSSIWSFMFLPTELQQYDYLIVNCRPKEDPSGFHHSFQIVSPCYHFISEKPKTSTIVLMYQGGENGHFSSLLFPNPNPNQKDKKRDDLKRKILESFSGNAIQVKFTKVQSALWKPVADIFRDLSLEDFQKGKREPITIVFPEEDQAAVKEVHITIDSSQDGKASQEEENASQDGNATQGQNAAASQAADTAASQAAVVHPKQNDAVAGPEQPSEDSQSPQPPKTHKKSKAEKQVERVALTVSTVYDLCSRADEWAHLNPETMDIKELTRHADELGAIAAQARLSVQNTSPLKQHAQERNKALTTEFEALGSLIHGVTELHDKYRRIIATKKVLTQKGTKKAAGAKAAAQETGTKVGPMDLFFKVPSIMPADDICDEISGTELLSLFRIDPTPTFIASFYYSLVAVSTRPQVQQEMEEIFHQKLIECKSCASSLCEQTRSRFHEVEEKCMVRGGKTFREYLSAKHVDSWDKIGFDNVLGEVSLCSQVWKLNIALIWRYNNVWRLFVCAHGGASPINTILYAKTRVQVDAEGRTSFAAGTARRFFPIDPINDEWFESSLFTQSIPESVPQEPELPAAVQFRKHLDKEFALQSVIECEGAAS